MKIILAVFAILTPFQSMAGWVATKKIDLPPSIGVISLTTGNVGCSLSFPAAPYSRQIAQGAEFFEMAPLKITQPAPMTVELAKMVLLAFFGIKVEGFSGSLDELKDFASKTHGIVVSDETGWLANVSLKSKLSGSTAEIVCLSATILDEKRVLGNLVTHSPLQPDPNF